MTEMRALHYTEANKFSIRTDYAKPTPKDDECLVRVTYCGMCGTDDHIACGEFTVKFPLVPGHEAVGVIEAVGKDVTQFKVGDRAVADVGITCGKCFYCRRGNTLLCTDFRAKGVSTDGGFAEYLTYAENKLYKIDRLTDLEATLLEPASCAIHGLDKLEMKVGATVLLIGAGPTGIILAQLLKLNGASKVVIAANEGIKMKIARECDAADEYWDLKRGDAAAQWAELKKAHPYGFDVVAECTGVESIVQDSINYVRRGGTLLVYGVYSNEARVSWPPSKIFGDEIKIIGSFSQVYCFPRAVEYLESGKIKLKGLVTDIFPLEGWQDALDKMHSRAAGKIAIKVSEPVKA